MVSSPALTDQLDALTAALDDPGTDLHAILDVLVDDLSAAVSSFLGLRMTLQSDWFPVTLTAIDPDLALSAGASLALPLGPAAGAGAGGTMVLYAGHPGAFVDLAADLERVPGLGGRVVLDGDLPGTSRPHAPAPPGVTGLAELGVMNRAIGVLITRGHPPAEARAELRRRAAVGLTSVTEVARHVLASTNAPPTRPLPAAHPDPRPVDETGARRSGADIPAAADARWPAAAFDGFSRDRASASACALFVISATAIRPKFGARGVTRLSGKAAAVCRFASTARTATPARKVRQCRRTRSVSLPSPARCSSCPPPLPGAVGFSAGFAGSGSFDAGVVPARMERDDGIRSRLIAG